MWLVFFGFLILLSIVEPLILETAFPDPQQRIHATTFSLILTRGIIFIWLFVGLFRANEKDYIAIGNTFKTRSIQAVLLMALLFTLVYSVETLQAAYFNKSQAQLAHAHQMKNSKSEPYLLALNTDRTRLLIKGELELGITREVRQLLNLNPDIRDIVLESPGGHIYEGRGLSLLFTEKQLNTRVYQACSSACATAFIGGKRRYLGNHARIGFHQYKQDKTYYPVPFVDLEIEQNRDLAIFKSQGIRDQFLKKAFAQDANHMWYPRPSELLQERVIDVIIESI